MAYESGSKMLMHCQTTDRANSEFGTNGLHGTPDVLTASKLQDGGASNKGAKQPSGPQAP